MPGFVFLTVVVNAATVIILPLLAAGLWYITAAKSCIGEKYGNNILENLLMLFLFFMRSPEPNLYSQISCQISFFIIISVRL